MDIHICKLPIADSDCFCTLQSEWDNGEIRIFLLHENKVWSGKFQLGKEEDLAELLDQLSLTEEKYMEDTKNALTTNGGLENFTYSIENNKFIWKKSMRKNMVVKFGYICLSEASVVDTYQTVMDSSLRLNNDLTEKLLRSNHQKEILISENSFLKDKISELTEQKIEMEENLYCQFLYLLNEKKKKIAELTRKMDFQASNEDTLDSDNDHDPFDTDTELESDEGESVSQSKETSIKTRDSLDEEDYNPGILPKKTRRAQNQTVEAPGPSGNSSGLHSAKLNDDRKPYLTPERKSKVRNKPRLFGDLEQNSTEDEDPFAFPKRSKRVPLQKDVELNNPSKTLKCDTDDETPIETTVKIEQDSDNTPSDLALNDIDVKSDSEPKSDGSKFEPEKTSEQAELTQTYNGYEGLSSPTRTMLDRLI